MKNQLENWRVILVKHKVCKIKDTDTMGILIRDERQIGSYSDMFYGPTFVYTPNILLLIDSESKYAAVEDSRLEEIGEIDLDD